MSKFIKLTERYTDGKTLPLIINVDRINSVKLSERGRDTHINMLDNRYFFVTESVDNIQQLLITPFMTSSDDQHYQLERTLGRKNFSVSRKLIRKDQSNG